MQFFVTNTVYQRVSIYSLLIIALCILKIAFILFIAIIILSFFYIFLKYFMVILPKTSVTTYIFRNILYVLGLFLCIFVLIWK